MVDWGAGSYETTAAELAPVAEAIVERARIAAGDDVVDLACGTGNAALLAAARGARVVGVDAAPRLLAVAGERAREQGLELDLREGDLLGLPVDDRAADVAVSVFGLIFAREPADALREAARILRPGGRLVMTAWIPEGPIDAMIGATARIARRVTGDEAPRRFRWFDPDALGPVAAEAGLDLEATSSARLAIRAASPEAYVAAGQEHPMSLAMRPVLERAGVEAEARDAATAILREANEDPAGFLVHSPYVTHELGARAERS